MQHQDMPDYLLMWKSPPWRPEPKDVAAALQQGSAPRRRPTKAVRNTHRRQIVRPLDQGRWLRGLRGLRWLGVAGVAGLGVGQNVLVHGLQVLDHVAGARAGLVVHLLVADPADDFVAAQLDERAPRHRLVLARHVVVVVVEVQVARADRLGPGLGPGLGLRARRLRRHGAAAAD